MPSKWRHVYEGLGSATIKMKHENISGQNIYWMFGWDKENACDKFQEVGCIQGHYLIIFEGSSNDVEFMVGCYIVYVI